MFTGSSNLAAGGEEANGDSLVMIDDPVIASVYGIEAVRLFDHYAFRRDMAKATKIQPLTLWSPGKAGAPAFRAFVWMQGHNYANFADPQVQPMLLRGIAWAGKRSADALATERPPQRGRGGRGRSGQG